jgi:hypothetical protein
MPELQSVFTELSSILRPDATLCRSTYSPCLLDSVSSDLKRRMQGKSCFTFTFIDKKLFGELAGLAKAGYASYREQGYA